MTTVQNSERALGFEKTFFFTLRQRTADPYRTQLLGCWAATFINLTVLIPPGSQRLHQFVFTGLRDGTERTSDVVNLEDDESDSLLCVGLQVEVEDHYTFRVVPSSIDLRRHLLNRSER